MSGILSALLSLLSSLLPALSGSSSTITTIINSLIEIIPLLVKEYEDVVPYIKNIIVTLKADPATTQAQLDQLDALDKQVDDAFDIEAARVEAEDKS